MTDTRALAERLECLRDWAGNRAAERDLDGFEALALHIANDAEALSTENAELKRQLEWCREHHQLASHPSDTGKE